MTIHSDYAHSVHYAHLSSAEQAKIGHFVGTAGFGRYLAHGPRYELWGHAGCLTWHISGHHGGAGPLLGWGGSTIGEALNDLCWRAQCNDILDWRRGSGYVELLQDEAQISTETVAQRHTAACIAAYGDGPGCFSCRGRSWCSRCGNGIPWRQRERHAESPLTLTLSYAPPLDPPSHSVDWPEKWDYPGVKAVVSLPTANDNSSDLRPDLRASGVTCCGGKLYIDWGEPHGFGREPGPHCRRRESVFRAATLEEAETNARAWHADGVAVLESVISARAARLAQRDVTIAAAHERPGTIEVPAT